MVLEFILMKVKEKSGEEIYKVKGTAYRIFFKPKTILIKIMKDNKLHYNDQILIGFLDFLKDNGMENRTLKQFVDGNNKLKWMFQSE